MHLCCPCGNAAVLNSSLKDQTRWSYSTQRDEGPHKKLFVVITSHQKSTAVEAFVVLTARACFASIWEPNFGFLTYKKFYALVLFFVTYKKLYALVLFFVRIYSCAYVLK